MSQRAINLHSTILQKVYIHCSTLYFLSSYVIITIKYETHIYYHNSDYFVRSTINVDVLLNQES